MPGELLRRMTVIDGLGGDDEGELGEESRPDLMVRDSLPTRMAEAAGRATVRLGGAYGAATGVSALVLAATGLPEYLLLFPAGMCTMHACGRMAEGWTWHSKGGRAAEKRRRKYQGEASPLHVRNRLSPAAAAKKMKGLAPMLPAAQTYLPVGTTVHKPQQKVAISRGESVAAIGVPQSYKTALLSNWIIEAPGPVLATSSRADQWRHTTAVREQMGEVLVLDADGYGPGTNFGWDPVEGCADPDTAIRRAGDFMHASPRDPSGKDSWHEDRGARLLRLALHAAALEGGNMLDVRAWVQHPDDKLFFKALQASPVGAAWGEALTALCSQDGDFLNSAITSAESALGWMDSPLLQAVACPEKGTGLDVMEFLSTGTNTVYLIGSKRPYGSLTPFFSAFSSEFMEAGRHLAERQGGRLAMPLTVIADEAATTARIDFERWLAVSAGYNITIVAGFQALSQVESGWGGGASSESILTMFSTKIFGGGMTSPAELERVSVVCGDQSTWRRERGGKVIEKERVFPPERIRLLGDFHVLLVHRNAKPVEVVVNPVWNHRRYQPVAIAAGEFTEED
jgi:type IV secretion system protein VirD4